jgi:hypothetical protein
MNKQELNEEILDNILGYVAAEAMEEMGEQYPPEEELDVTFSPEFESRMDAFFHKRKRNGLINSLALKVCAAAAVVLAVSVITVINADALRSRVVEFFSEWGAKATTIHVESTDYGTYEQQLQGLYVPEYIPADYSLEVVNKFNREYRLEFKNKNGAAIFFQNFLEGKSYVDSEDATVDQAKVNNDSAMFFTKDDNTSLIFKYDENVFLLTCTADAQLSRDELIKMAGSLRYLK